MKAHRRSTLLSLSFFDTHRWFDCFLAEEYCLLLHNHVICFFLFVTYLLPHIYHYIYHYIYIKFIIILIIILYLSLHEQFKIHIYSLTFVKKKEFIQHHSNRLLTSVEWNTRPSNIMHRICLSSLVKISSKIAGQLKNLRI